MIALGIESTAHTFGVGLVSSEGRVLSNALSAYSSPEGGLKPGEAAEHHAREALHVISRALEQAEVSLKDVGLVGFAQGPGLGQPLQVGAVTARTLAVSLGTPLVGVNHPIAHIEIGRLVTRADDPLIVYVSGGNTQIMVHEQDRFRIIGETLDIGLGNAQEKVGRLLGLPFPAGPHLDRVEGDWVDLPYTVKGMDLSFSGLVTEVERKLKEGADPSDLAWSFVEVAFSMLVEVSERALAATGRSQLLIVGGVAASPRLQEKMASMCRDRGVQFLVPPREYLRDNGAMIAWTALLAYAQFGSLRPEESVIRPRWRPDEVEWRLLSPEELDLILSSGTGRAVPGP
uniref:tRNA N6-adenosine threonylcarbamoyltransferase n=1 Tax=uncultured korarchaeote TaxID=161241 RepID=A0A1L2JT75_9CREN|nr:metal-dependent proteases with possible chaperone activity [uncultured korarchaeote]